jgi:hypothetical protein
VYRCGCSAGLKHCFVEWFFLSRGVGKKGGKKGGQAGRDGISCLSFLMHCSLLGRHLGKEGGREDKLEELKSIASFPSFE